MNQTGLNTDSISLEGYVDIKEIINWHIKNNYHHILERDDHKMMFDVKHFNTHRFYPHVFLYSS